MEYTQYPSFLLSESSVNLFPTLWFSSLKQALQGPRVRADPCQTSFYTSFPFDMDKYALNLILQPVVHLHSSKPHFLSLLINKEVMWGSVKNLPKFQIYDIYCFFPVLTCYSLTEVVLVRQYFFWKNQCLLFISLSSSKCLQIVSLFSPEFLQKLEFSWLVSNSWLRSCLN